MERREFLKGAAASLSVSALPGWVAAAQSGNRFVFMLLRGGMDGLSAVVPYEDSDYRRLRGPLALARPGSGDPAKLDGYFSLHPALPYLAKAYRDQQLTIIPSAASVYRERSHFDGQNVLENGGLRPYQFHSGWLNRSLTSISEGANAVAIGGVVPLVLRGEEKVQNWSPSTLPAPGQDLYDRLSSLYDKDDVLAERLDALIQTNEQLGKSKRPGRGRQSFIEMAEAAGKLLNPDSGPQVATLELSGWDTHANQGAEQGRLARNFSVLDDMLNALQSTLADRWQQTVVMVMTEFGRTVSVNGSNGTDHGTASAVLVLGGAVKGGNILGEWPGLKTSDLIDGRDLRPIVDQRALLKTVLNHQLSIPMEKLETQVFPDTQNIKPFPLLFRS